jgi:putative FmdB family regulatory protein
VPLYTYHCNRCQTDIERTVKLEERDNQRCGRCKGGLERSGVECFAVGKPRYQMQAVLADGRHVKGHFGKTAALDKSKRVRKA